MSIPTIVCVDDERNILLTLRTQLSRHFPDCTIEITESAAEALELVDELLSEGVEIPLVIVDQIMPGMKGDELLIELHTRHPEILKVMLTGQARAEDVGNVVNQGNLYRFIAKPWNEADLNLTVTEALRRYRKDQQLLCQQTDLEQGNQKLAMLNGNLAWQKAEQCYLRISRRWHSSRAVKPRTIKPRTVKPRSGLYDYRFNFDLPWHKVNRSRASG